MATIINSTDVPEVTGSRYPSPHDVPCRGRHVRRLAEPVGISQFGVNLCRIPPGVWSSQRHHHSHEDELLVMMSGEISLVDNAGERVLHPGDVVGFPAGDGNAHHLVNRSGADATFLAIGTDQADDVCTYPDIGMTLVNALYRVGENPYQTLTAAATSPAIGAG